METEVMLKLLILFMYFHHLCANENYSHTFYIDAENNDYISKSW